MNSQESTKSKSQAHLEKLALPAAINSRLKAERDKAMIADGWEMIQIPKCNKTQKSRLTGVDRLQSWA